MPRPSITSGRVSPRNRISKVLSRGRPRRDAIPGRDRRAGRRPGTGADTATSSNTMAPATTRMTGTPRRHRPGAPRRHDDRGRASPMTTRLRDLPPRRSVDEEPDRRGVPACRGTGGAHERTRFGRSARRRTPPDPPSGGSRGSRSARQRGRKSDPRTRDLHRADVATHERPARIVHHRPPASDLLGDFVAPTRQPRIPRSVACIRSITCVLPSPGRCASSRSSSPSSCTRSHSLSSSGR